MCVCVRAHCSLCSDPCQNIVTASVCVCVFVKLHWLWAGTQVSLAWTWHPPHKSICTLRLSGSSVFVCVCACLWACVCVSVWVINGRLRLHRKVLTSDWFIWLLIHLLVKVQLCSWRPTNIIYLPFSHNLVQDVESFCAFRFGTFLFFSGMNPNGGWIMTLILFFDLNF